MSDLIKIGPTPLKLASPTNNDLFFPIDAAGFEPTSFPTLTVRRITNDATRQLGGATSCKLATITD